MPLVESSTWAAQVTLAWDPNSEPDIAGYRVHYGNASGDYRYNVDVKNTTGCTISGLQAGSVCYFSATAYNSRDHESGYSKELVYAIPVPPPPSVDTDGDGIIDSDEINIYGTNPEQTDTDGDGINDGQEVAFWGNSWDADVDSDGLVNLLDADSDNDDYADGREVADGSDPSDSQSFPPPSAPSELPSLSLPIMEIGEVILDHNWRRIDLQESFVEPVVIANAFSLNGTDPAVIRIRNINPDGFEMRVQEWDYLDGSHAEETISYLVMERGSYTLADGTLVEAGRFETDKTGSFGTIAFVREFQEAPVVMTAITTDNEQDAPTGRMRRISTQGFEFCMQEQEKNTRTHQVESIDYIAWEPSIGTIDYLQFKVGKTADAVRHKFFTVKFADSFQDTPLFLAGMQSADGMDTANVRWKNKDAVSIKIQIDEEQSRNTETRHTKEVVGYFVFAPAQ